MHRVCDEVSIGQHISSSAPAHSLTQIMYTHAHAQIVMSNKKGDWTQDPGLVFEVKDRDRIIGFIKKKPDLLGVVQIPIQHILSAPNKKLENWFDVIHDNSMGYCLVVCFSLTAISSIRTVWAVPPRVFSRAEPFLLIRQVETLGGYSCPP